MSKKGVAPLRELLYYIEIWGMLQQYFAYNKDKNICWGRCNKLSSRVCWYPVADENEGVHPAGRKHISKHLKCFWHKHLWGHLGPRVSDIFGSKTNQAGAKMILAGGKIILAGGKIILAGGKIILVCGKIILAGGKIILASRWENNFGRWENYFRRWENYFGRWENYFGRSGLETGHILTIQLEFWRP